MVAIVIVSHSAKLAEGVAELAQQMVQNRVLIAVAAGIDDPENPLGTDVLKIQAAIESVYTDSGVVVLMDLGSAIPSTEMAVEFLTPEQQQNVKLCEAPLVEGTIAAAVQASIGGDIQQVLAEACSALTPKISQLSSISDSSQITDNQLSNLTTQAIQVTVENHLGLHARPAGQFVSTAAQFQSQITLKNLTKNSSAINAKSINQVIGLAIQQGNQIEITATGEDAELGLNRLQEFIQNLSQDISAEPLSIPTHEILTPDISAEHLYNLRGIPASPGIAIGEVIHYQPTFPDVSNRHTNNPEREWQNLQIALQTAQQELQNIRDSSDIFQAHLLFLEDPELLQQTQALIFEQNYTAAFAWKTVIEEIISTYQALEDPYFRARSVDVQDIGIRVLRLLTGTAGVSLNLPQPGILIAPDLTPSEVAQLSPHQVLGICTVTGSLTSHSTLIANMLGIPMIVNVGEEIVNIASGTEIAFNGKTGEIWLEPDEVKLQELQPKTLTQSDEPSPIPLRANIMGVADAKFALDCGAMGVGLLRTELLYLERVTPPTEEEQVQIYEAIAQTLSPHPLTIRTLDVGGDKPVPYLNLEPEANPFLGWRGIRQSLETLDIFKTQLRAILRVSATQNIKLMFPMVASITEVKAAKRILSQVKTEFRTANILFDEQIKIGMMIEVPSAVLMADQLASEVDFFSIGTNDLSQYIMAADRTNSKVSHLADAFEPAVLRAIENTIKQAHRQGISVSLCGQLASLPEAAPLLFGLGVDELSVNPRTLASVKIALSQCVLEQAKEMAEMALQLDSAQSVKNYLSSGGTLIGFTNSD